MPTGHTEKILDGCTFEEFVWSCARSMGFMIHMKEDPTDAPISISKASLFEESWHRNQLDKLTQNMDMFLGFSEYDWSEYIEAQCTEEINMRIKIRETASRTKKLYEEMLDKVSKWNAPDEFDFLKEYLFSQIQDSIKHDCIESKYNDPNLVEKSSKEYILKETKKCIEYHKKELEKEKERETKRLEYIQALDKSVPRPQHLIPENER